MRILGLYFLLLPLCVSNVHADTTQQDIFHAVNYYKNGNWNASKIYLESVLSKHAKIGKGNVDTLKLEILFALEKNQDHIAATKMKQFVEKQENAYYLYLLGQLSFLDRRFKKASEYFHRSVESALKDQVNKQSAYLVAPFFKERSLFLCQLDRKNTNLERVQVSLNNFSNKKNAKTLWNKKMSREEIRLAAFYARILRTYFHQTLDNKQEDIEDKFITLTLPTTKESRLDKLTSKMIMGPGNTEDFDSCIKSLRWQLLNQYTGIPLRSNDKRLIQSYSYLLLLSSLFVNNNIESRFKIASYLIQNKKNLEAMHAIRSIKGRERFYLLQTKSDFYNLKIFLGKSFTIYKNLYWKANATSIKRMLNVLSSFETKLKKGDGNQTILPKLRDQIILQMRWRASENKNNKESLEFLFQHTSSKQILLHRKYKNMIKKLEEIREEKELPAAFLYYYK